MVSSFDKAIEIINSNGIYGIGFADDWCALVGGTNLGYMVHKLQKVIDDLVRWGNSVGLAFNEKKTIAIHFTRTKQTTKFQLKMNNKPIEYSKSCTYLGLKIDSKLAWKEHVEEKINKCKRFLMKTVHETRANFGPKPKLMKWGFTGMVSCLLYTSPSPRDLSTSRMPSSA